MNEPRRARPGLTGTPACDFETTALAASGHAHVDPVRLTDNRVVLADDNYIRESILEPNAKVVSGFQSIMPTFRGVVSEDEIMAITEYIKHLAPQESNPLNNRTTPTQIRDSEVPNIQQQNKQQNEQQPQQSPQGTRPANPSGKKP